MNKKTEIGLEHIKKLHISAFRDARAIYNEFSRKYGQKKSHEIVDALYKAADQSQKELYEKKNSDYDIAMIFSGGYDADIVRRCCNWIAEHKDAFGDEILEIGCDCGFITTFLGELFPEKHITAIDRCAAGIEIAKKNVEKFGLTNVDFICDDVINMNDKRFDTVFSMRTMQENGDDAEELCSNELIEQSELFEEAKKEYASKIVSLIKDNGTLISIERIGINALFLAWLRDLGEFGMKLESHHQIQCREVGDVEFFQAMSFVKSNVEDINADEDFFDCFFNYINPDLSEYTGWDAKILYELTGGKLISGYEAIDNKNKAKSKVVVRMYEMDDSCILLYNNNNGDVHLYYLDVSQKNDAIKSVENAINEVKGFDYYNIIEMKDE